MSCIGFLSPQQRALLRASTPDGVLSSFASPKVTEGKVARTRLMASSDDSKIRESAALAHATPPDVLTALSGDLDPGVRMSVARNEHTPSATLRLLAGDSVAGVRGWVAANPSVPQDVLDLMANDADPTVRSVVDWASRWPDG